MKNMALGIMVAAALAFMPLATAAQEEPAAEAAAEHQHHSPAGETAPQPENEMHKEMMHHCEAMMERCKAMVEKRVEAMEKMEAMDARLNEKIAAMNEAEGEQKVQAMAAVINEMAAQRATMMEEFQGMRAHPMCPMMMQGHGMRGHGMRGHPMCPMMQRHGSPAMDAPQHH